MVGVVNRGWQLLLYSSAPVLVVTLTDPTPTGTPVIADASPTITWALSAGTQVDYRVRVYADALGATLVYDSGWVASASLGHTIPAGQLQTGTAYWVAVSAHTSAGGSGTSALTDFTTSFATSGNVSLGAAKVLGGCAWPEEVPGLRVQWTQVVPGAGETFVQYDIWRRLRRETTAWTRIATVTAIATTRYDDYAVRSREVYEYAVTYQATASGATLVSAVQSSPAHGSVDFDFSWIHLVGSPTNALQWHGWEGSLDLAIEVVTRQPLGRTVPAGYAGGLQQRRIDLSGLEQPFRQDEQWELITALVTAQRTEGRALCVRRGVSGELLYALITGARRGDRQRSYSPSISVEEIHFEEAV